MERIRELRGKVERLFELIRQLEDALDHEVAVVDYRMFYAVAKKDEVTIHDGREVFFHAYEMDGKVHIDTVSLNYYEEITNILSGLECDLESEIKGENNEREG